MAARSYAFVPVCLAVALASQAPHAGVFDVTATVGNNTASGSFSTVDAALNTVTDQGLFNLNNTYNGTQNVNIDLDFRGVGMQLAFPLANSTLLTLSIPAINVDQQFQGTTRDDSQQQLKDYIKKNPQLLSELEKALVQSSPVDPVAGNPNSMMSRDVSQSFSNGLVTPSSVDDKSTTQQPSNSFGVSVAYSNMVNSSVTNPRDMTSDSVSLPISYTHKFATPGEEFDFYMPLAETTVQGSKSYDAGLNASFRMPVMGHWYLAFSGGLSAAGSADLGSGVAMANGVITSSYVIPGEHWSYTIGDMIGEYSALKVKVQDASYNPGIHNTVYRNGVLIQQDTGIHLFGEPATVEYTLIDTRYTGTDLFNKSQDEIGVTFGSKREPNARTSDYRGGLLYTHAPHAKGWGFNFGYWF